MPSFACPDPPYNYSLKTETDAVDEWFQHRGVPKSANGKLLLASWNIANLGEQKRKSKDLKLIAHIMKRFDLIAVQEVKNDFSHFTQVVELMGSMYDWIINDTAGNSERLGFVYNTGKVRPGRLFGEVALAQKDFPKKTVTVSYTKKKENRVEVYYDLEFTPFDRNPFVATFSAGNFDFTLANVHLYFGAFKDASSVEERAKYARRVLEVFTLGQWAKKRRKGEHTYDKDILLLGDMNVPEMTSDDAAFRALKSSGLLPLDYKSNTAGSNLGGTKTYDQLVVSPGPTKSRILQCNVFDFDNRIFRSKWNELEKTLNEKMAASKFNGYVKFHVSDHRPLWVQLDVT